MVADPAHITNRVIIFLFIKNLYNCDIQKWISGAKMITTLADAFKLAPKMGNINDRKYNSLHTRTNIDESNKGKFTSKISINKTSKTYTYWGTC